MSIFSRSNKYLRISFGTRLSRSLLRPLPFVAALLLCVIGSANDKNDKNNNNNKDSSAEVKFSARAELVMVPVVVTDKSGVHINGLKKEDFTVLENGSERPIATFEEVSSQPDRLIRRPHPGEFTNDVTSGGRSTRRITLIVLDVLNTPFLDQTYARNQLLKYLTQSLDRREPTGLFMLDRRGIHVVHDFTSDPQVLIAALHKVMGEPLQLADTQADLALSTGTTNPIGSQTGGVSGMTGAPAVPTTALMSAVSAEAAAFQSMSQDAALNMAAFEQRVAITYTLDALQQVTQMLAGVPGRKALIWAGGGFPFSVSNNTMGLAPAGRDTLNDILPKYERTWELLNEAQIALYPIDVKGLQPNMPNASDDLSTTPGTDGFNNYVRSTDWRQLDTQSTFESFAAATGGRAYFNSNDLVKGFRDAVHDSEQYYMVGYYLDRSNTKPGWRKLAVKVKREHVEVRARSGFFVTNATVNPEITHDTDLAAALKSPLDYTGLSLDARWDDVAPGKEPGKKSIRFIVNVEPDANLFDTNDNNHIALEFLAVARSSTGDPASQPSGKKYDLHPKPDVLATIQQKGISYRGAVELAPGEYNVRIVVRDSLSGRIGSVAAPLKVE
ncbi:MAG: VWA domain-containing protein [Terriglobales bacterium]|jgi:VWFA-related protein